MNGGSRNGWRPHGVSTGLSGLALLLLVGLLHAAPKKPPSSLQKPGALVRFSHVHERIASCKARVVDGEPICVEQARVPAAAGIDFALTPEPGQLVSQPTAQREPVEVSLPSHQGSSTLELWVESGNWLLSWADQRAPFYVDLQGNFTVELATLSGACVEEQGQCLRHDEVISRTVIIPPEHLGAH